MAPALLFHSKHLPASEMATSQLKISFLANRESWYPISHSNNKINFEGRHISLKSLPIKSRDMSGGLLVYHGRELGT